MNVCNETSDPLKLTEQRNYRAEVESDLVFNPPSKSYYNASEMTEVQHTNQVVTTISNDDKNDPDNSESDSDNYMISRMSTLSIKDEINSTEEFVSASSEISPSDHDTSQELSSADTSESESSNSSYSSPDTMSLVSSIDSDTVGDCVQLHKPLNLHQYLDRSDHNNNVKTDYNVIDKDDSMSSVYDSGAQSGAGCGRTRVTMPPVLCLCLARRGYNKDTQRPTFSDKPLLMDMFLVMPDGEWWSRKVSGGAGR